MSQKTFEQAMKQLEQIVEALESGDLPLEKAISKFEEGIHLSKFCSDLLDETEKKITLLTQGQKGDISEKPFPTDNATDDSQSE
jgi:exodeoxyribonuclease VII small subunit